MDVDTAMLSLKALLAESALELEVQVSGPDGALDREVLWLHNTELPDPAPYIRASEVVLTNGLWRDATTATGFVAALQRARAAGLIFGLTEQNRRVPDDLVGACTAADLPLIS